MIINEEENIWTHTTVTDQHASDFFGLRTEYDGPGKQHDTLWLNYPGNEGRQIQIKIPKTVIAQQGWLHIMPLIKQRLGFFAEDINTRWKLTDDAQFTPDPENN